VLLDGLEHQTSPAVFLHHTSRKGNAARQCQTYLLRQHGWLPAGRLRHRLEAKQVVSDWFGGRMSLESGLGWKALLPQEIPLSAPTRIFSPVPGIGA